MEINFHYAAVKVLAFNAGFSEPEAQTIAYASQHVDDAVLSKPLLLDRDPGVSGIRFGSGNLFDPICTAHKGFGLLSDLISERARRVVLRCFHFLPNPELPSNSPRFKVVVPGSSMGRDLLLAALEELKNAGSEPGEPRARALIKLGIALHSYADTWAHQGFSGDYDDDTNDLSSLELLKAGAWKKGGLKASLLAGFSPDIGHAQAGTVPDQPDITWRSEPRKRKPSGFANSAEFLRAARTIYDLLSAHNAAKAAWAKIRSGLRSCFQDPAREKDFTNAKAGSWKASFPNIPFQYHHAAWFNSALKAPPPQVGAAGLMASNSKHTVLAGREYFYFHALAGEQREALKNLVG